MADALQWQVTGLWRPSHITLGQLPFYGQIADPQAGEVYIPLSDMRTAQVTVSLFDPIAAAVPGGTTYARMLRAYYRGAPVFWGAINQRKVNYKAGTMTLMASDRMLSLVRHFLRRGDAASEPLTITGPNDEANIAINAVGMRLLRDAGLNTIEQLARDMPGLGIINGTNDGTSYPAGLRIGIKRGDQVSNQMRQLSQALGPDFELAPIDHVAGAYAQINTYGVQGDDVSYKTQFHYGTGRENLEDLEEIEGVQYVTHVHVLDREGRFRVTRANIDASDATGAYVHWEPTEFDTHGIPLDKIEDVLERYATDILKAWSRPLSSYNLTLKPGTDEQLRYLRDYRVGDTVGLAGRQGHAETDAPVRITGVRLQQLNADNQIRPVLEVVADRVAGDDLTGIEE